MIEIESNIIQRCKDGDRTAFRMLVQHTQRMVFSLALKMICDEDDAKDIVQETFIKIWTSIRNYDETQSLSTWIYTIATRTALDKLKQKKHMLPLPNDNEVLKDYATSYDGQRQLENKEWVALVRTIAEGLGEKQRLVFTLCQLEGLSSDEVQEITEMDASQVKSNLYVARKIVKERLEKLGYE